MNRVKNQSGFSAGALLLVLLVIAAVGVIGWQVGRSHKNSTGDTNKTPAGSNPAPSTVASEDYCLATENLCFTHHSGWTAKDTSGDKTILDTPYDNSSSMQIGPSGGSAVLTAYTFLPQLGGGCDDGNMREQIVAGRQQTGVTVTPQGEYWLSNVYAMQLIWHGVEDGKEVYVPQLMLTNEKDYIQNDRVKSCPGTVYADVIPGKSTLTLDGQSGRASLRVFSSGTSQFSTEAAAKAVFDTADYKTAYQILASAHYK